MVETVPLRAQLNRKKMTMEISDCIYSESSELPELSAAQSWP